ncbi:hypothetical protein [Dyella sp.]|uniref:hypothetical protein n=1 Tax=Dyella sp. TaxID=1869338 RepID=UPI002FD906D0
MKAWLILLGAMGACAMLTLAYQAGEGVAEHRCEVARAVAKDAARSEAERRDGESAAGTAQLHDNLGTQLPAMEAEAHAATERIRTIYVEAPVSGVCTRPDGVQAELDAARARANAAAARGL